VGRWGAFAVVAVALSAACAQEAAPAAAPEPPSSWSRPTTTAPTTTSTTTAPTTTTTAPPVTDLFALVPPTASAGPEGLVDQIVEAEMTLRNPNASELDTAEAALLHQVAYRKLGAHPEWDAAVSAALPEGLRGVAQLQAAARREFRGMHRKLSSTLPAWRIVAPDPAEELLGIYREAEAEFGIPWRYLAAINLVETGIGRIRGTSIAGAQGPMQFMPATWEAYGGGGDINDTRDAIRGAARYLAANGGATDIAPALYRYNHSNRYVRGVQMYADLIDEHPRAYLAFYYWGIWYLTDQGEVYLPVGYEQSEPIPVTSYVKP
jgi:soluble lytic murein transglycosylase-like protein